jgi:hypothetical protein
VKWSADETAEVPVGVTIVMSTVPTRFGGATAVMSPLEFTVKFVEVIVPNTTSPAPVK